MLPSPRRIGIVYIYLATVVAILFGLAFNVYVPPNNGDDITYYHGALSIADGNGFKEQGKWIVDWPPVQSAIVAIAMRLSGIREYYLAKIVNGLAVLGSLAIAYLILLREHRCRPLLSCMLIAIFPTSLLVGSAGQADFSYFLLSMVFLLLVDRLRQNRTFGNALLCGVLLGIISLTRWQGVLLGACLVFQAAQNWLGGADDKAKMTLKALGYEAMASFIGASIFLGWKYWLSLCIARGEAGVSNYDYSGTSIWNLPDPVQLFSSILNLFTQFENVVLTLSPSLGWLVTAIATLLMLICTWGVYLRISQYGWKISDVFTLSSLLLLSVYAYKESRYIIPIAPFLFDYLFRGLGDLHHRVHRFIGLHDAWLDRFRIGFFTLWMAGLLAFDAILIFYGDGESMGPACQLLLSDNRDYLRGYHRDLYEVCQQLHQGDSEAVVATDKFHKQLVRHYSGLRAHFVGYAPNEKYDVFVQIDQSSLPKRADDLTKKELEFPPSLEGRLSNPRTTGLVTLWDVDALKKE